MGTTHTRITERDKERLKDIADEDESMLMAIRAAVSALERERENNDV